MKWCRLYAEFASDAKVQSMPEKMQRRLVMLFCLTTTDELAKISEAELAIVLRLSRLELANTKQLFLAKGFIEDSWKLKNWDKRQYCHSDNSAIRVNKYRAKREALGMTRGASYNAGTIIARDNGACVYCGKTTKLCVDHAKPISLGGTDDENNLVCACKECNAGKAGRTPEMAGFSWINLDAKSRYDAYMSQGVTVSVTPPDTDTDTDTEIKPKTSSASDDAVRAQESLITRRKRKLNGKRYQSFMRFWEAFDYKKDRAQAADAWLDIPQLTNAMVAQIVAAAQTEAKNRPDLIARGRTPIYAQGWITARRWEDEPYEAKEDYSWLDGGGNDSTRIQ